MLLVCSSRYSVEYSPHPQRTSPRRPPHHLRQLVEHCCGPWHTQRGYGHPVVAVAAAFAAAADAAAGCCWSQVQHSRGACLVQPQLHPGPPVRGEG